MTTSYGKVTRRNRRDLFFDLFFVRVNRFRARGEFERERGTNLHMHDITHVVCIDALETIKQNRGKRREMKKKMKVQFI